MSKFFFSAILLILSSASLSQNFFDQETFLRFSNVEGTLVGWSSQIQVFDIDDDAKNEILILVVDTLFIIDENSIQKYYPYSQSQNYEVNYWSLHYREPGIDQKEIYSINYQSTLIWSVYNLVTGGWRYSGFNFWLLNGISCNPTGKLWFVNRDINKVNVLAMDDLESIPDTVTYIGEGDSIIQMDSGQFGHAPIFLSNNGEYISIIQTGNNLFISGNPGGVYHYYSKDYGNTWTGEIIARGHTLNPVFGQVSNRNLAPYLTNSTYSGAVDDNGVFHFAILGWGLTIENSDTTELNTILYWNSRDKELKAITNPFYEADRDVNGNLLMNYSPAHVYGQSMPSLAVSNDGSNVMVTWIAPEYSGEPGVSTYNIYPGDGGIYSKPVYYTDILANISFDGGKTWKADGVFPLKNKKNFSEGYLSLNQKLIYCENNNIKADYFYAVDAIPGWSGLFQNSESDSNMWFYDNYQITLTGVENPQTNVYKFSLVQNYPNPFNSMTTIKYSISSKSKVDIRVFNILGQQVIKLVDEDKPAGEHEVHFNAVNLASGVYFYSIKAADYTETKKMILIK